MTIHPAPSLDVVYQQDPDSEWTLTDDPAAQPTGPLEQVMLAEDKIFVVLAVVLVIWMGIMFFIYQTDRRVRALEKRLEDDQHPA